MDFVRDPSDETTSANKLPRKWEKFWNNKAYENLKNDAEHAVAVQTTGEGRCQVRPLSIQSVRAKTEDRGSRFPRDRLLPTTGDRDSCGSEKQTLVQF